MIRACKTLIAATSGLEKGTNPRLVCELNGPLTKDGAAWQEWRRHKSFDPAVFIEQLKELCCCLAKPD